MPRPLCAAGKWRSECGESRSRLRMPARSPGGAPVGLVASQPRHDLQVRITCRSSYLSGNRAMPYAWALTVCCTDCCDGWAAASRPRSASTSRETGKDAQEPNRSQGYSHNRVRRRSGPGAGRRRPLGSDDLRSAVPPDGRARLCCSPGGRSPPTGCPTEGKPAMIQPPPRPDGCPKTETKTASAFSRAVPWQLITPLGRSSSPS